ncbi:MAG: MBL fold metallo-hydrolase [Gaiellaceae bacterium]
MSAGLSTGSSVAVGQLALAGLPDAVGILGELDELYRDVPADAWEPYRALYPELFDGSRWRLPVACFLIRAGDRTIVVDAGVGPPGSWDWEGLQEGGLPGALAAQGMAPAELDCVFLTHLHVDHVGWLADDTFAPQAQLVVHQDALAFAIENSRIDWLPRRLRGLVADGRVETVADGAEVATGVTAWALPGHYPGHLGLRLESGSERAVLLVDTAVHPALLDRPEWRYVSDLDADTAVGTRRSVVAELAGTETLVACGHYPGDGIGRMVRSADGIVWEPVA